MSKEIEELEHEEAEDQEDMVLDHGRIMRVSESHGLSAPHPHHSSSHGEHHESHAYAHEMQVLP